MADVRRCAIFEGPLDADGVQVSSGQDEFGRELPDPVPVAAPVGYNAPPSLADMIRRMVANELVMRAVDQEGFETFEEAEDFELEDDEVDPRTPYEAVFDPPAAVPDASISKGGDASEPVVKRADDDPGPAGADRGSGDTQADPGSTASQ